jgi:Arc/MetJ-type ribon-helix-helix transcriptional regulator
MSDTTETTPPALEPVSVTFELPALLVAFYTELTEAGLFLSVEEALRQAVLSSFRFERGSFLNVRVDADAGEEKPTDQTEKQGQDPGPVTDA